MWLQNTANCLKNDNFFWVLLFLHACLCIYTLKIYLFSARWRQCHVPERLYASHGIMGASCSNPICFRLWVRIYNVFCLCIVFLLYMQDTPYTHLPLYIKYYMCIIFVCIIRYFPVYLLCIWNCGTELNFLKSSYS